MTTLQLLKKKNKKITYKDVKGISKYLQDEADKKGQNIKYGIKALAIDQWKTLKSMDNEMITEEDYDDYFVNKVSNVSKFNKFEQLQIYVIK
mmetsp:Transcript_4229/g.5580  ORF Transcript_4229/g.5580 Transcript_4229/m.5580 type:complete len:92 (-) Transcript_4229:109-384(-)